MHDALRSDVHPAARGHLTVVRDAHRGGAVKLLGLVKETHHQTVREDDARRVLVRAEDAERVTGLDDERLGVRELFQILLDQAVLHPVLADLAGLAVGHQLVGVQRHVEVQVVVDHDLDGPALDAIAFIFVNGFAVQLALRAEAVAVDPAAGHKLFHEFRRELLVEPFRNVAQRVLERDLHVVLGKYGIAPRRAANAFDKGLLFGKPVQLQYAVHRILLLSINGNREAVSSRRFRSRPALPAGE